MQQPADFFCKEFLPEHPRLEAPFLRGTAQAACVAQCRGTTSRTSPVQVQVLPRAPIWPASIKVMQRTFNPQNRARYPGGPPTHCLVVTAIREANRFKCWEADWQRRESNPARRVLTPTDLVQIQARQTILSGRASTARW